MITDHRTYSTRAVLSRKKALHGVKSKAKARSTCKTQNSTHKTTTSDQQHTNTKKSAIFK